MINSKNYFSEITPLLSKLPDALRKSHDLVDKVTQAGTNWETYNSNATIKRVIDLYFSKLNEWNSAQKPVSQKPVVKSKPAREPKKKLSAGTKSFLKSQKKAAKKPKAKKEKKVKQPAAGRQNQVERISEELRFIRRYVNMNGKKKTHQQILSLINGLQKAITEKRIRKESPYAKEIEHIQEQLILAHDALPYNGSAQIDIHGKIFDRLKEIAGSEGIITSIPFIKRYIGIHGKPNVKEKVNKLLTDLKKAHEGGKLTGDKYLPQLQKISDSLVNYINDSNPELKLYDASLNGKCVEILCGLGLLPALVRKALNGTKTKTHAGKKKVAKVICDSLGSPENPLYVRKSEIHGNGLFASEPIIEGTMILVAFRESGKFNEMAGKINHQDSPNAAPYLEGTRVIVRAITDIEPDTEITVDYSDWNKRMPEIYHTEDFRKKTLNGAKQGVMTIDQIKEQEHKSIPLAAHWKELIGEACAPTHLFVYGEGGSGKSSCVLQLSDHLSSMGFKILYVAGEQYGTPSFTHLLNTAGIKGNENFLIVKDLKTLNPADFDFVVLDSKESLNVDVDKFREMKKQYPKVSFIILSQGKKDGDFRGSESWRNETDTIIHCDKGIARTNDKNRWGGYGELSVFSMNK